MLQVCSVIIKTNYHEVTYQNNAFCIIDVCIGNELEDDITSMYRQVQ